MHLGWILVRRTEWDNLDRGGIWEPDMGTITVQVFGQGAESEVKSGLDIAPKPTDHRERRLVLGLPRWGAFGNLSTKKGHFFLIHIMFFIYQKGPMHCFLDGVWEKSQGLRSLSIHARYKWGDYKHQVGCLWSYVWRVLIRSCSTVLEG